MGMKDPSLHPTKKARREESSSRLDEKEDLPPDESAEHPSVDLEPGVVVLYWDGWRGVICDAFVAIDEYWVADEESGEVVRDDDGDIVHFKSSELEVVAGPPVAPPDKKHQLRGPPGGVVLIGDERQMTRVLNHFGPPQTTERLQPQMLLAFPCEKCESHDLSRLAHQGVDKHVRTFAQELRPDIYVSVRAYHLKHAVQAMGTDLLRMQGFFLLAAVTMPFSWDEINEAKGWMTKWRRDVCNQIDVGHTARGFCAAKGETVEETAKRTLGAEVGIQASDKLWEKDVQGEIRQRLDVDLPFTLCDVNGGTIIVLVLPSDAVVTFNAGILTFNENPDADYLAHDADNEEDIRAAEDDVAPVADARSSATSKPLDKTIGEWEKEQAQFAHLPRLPPHWVRVVSQKTGEVYFFNKRTQEATFEEPKVAEPPLPDGWTKQVSKSTGKTYYFHAGKKKSQFERPTE